MMRKLLILIVLIVGVSISNEVAAQPRLRTEWGLVAGASYPISKFEMGDCGATVKLQLGWSAGMHMALKFGRGFAIQPEIIYTYAKLNIDDPGQKFSTETTTNTLQVPILFSFRLGSALRLNAGPVLTVMDNPIYNDKNNEPVMFGRLYPTVTYAVGIGLSLWKHLLIDLRALSRFNTTTNYISDDAKIEGKEIKTTIHNIQLRVGYLF